MAEIEDLYNGNPHINRLVEDLRKVVEEHCARRMVTYAEIIGALEIAKDDWKRELRDG